MPFVQTFRRAHGNVPPVLQNRNPAEALSPTLSELSSFFRTHVQILPETSRRLVCDLSNNNFSLEHFEALTAWLQQPSNVVRIYALDLSFNRIQSASWDALVPLIKKLSLYAQHMDFGGNFLPPLLESEQGLKSLPNTVSLSVTYHSQSGDPWVDSWTQKSRHFKELAYGSNQMRWYERCV